jgi:transcriptional regulator of acetoin/glycerol metabolism
MLDEIGELPLQAQTRLLRVLQERVVTPVGSHRPEAVDFWLVSASHRDLAAMVAAGTFREDLYYRICGWRQQLAPLRAWSVPERQGLILNLLAQMDPALQLSREAEQRLLAHPLPGNVRQLKQALEVACVLAEGQGWIEPAHLHLPAVAGERAHLWEEYPARAEPAAGAADPGRVRRQRERGGAPSWHQSHHPLSGAAGGG